MPSMKWYRQARLPAWQAQVNWNTDTIVVTQHTNAYVPNPDTDAFVSNLTSEVATGLGYTQGGIALAAKTITYTPANAWTVQWAPNTSYAVGQVVRPPAGNGQLFECVVAGISSSSQPVWPAYGLTVTDGTVTWWAGGSGIINWNASNIQWPAYQGSFRYLVVSDRQSGVTTTEPLLGFLDMLATNTGTGGNLNVAWSPSVFYDLVP